MTELRLRGDISWCEAGGEIVALDSRVVNYVSTNGAGAKLWKALVDGTTRQGLAQELVDAYGIDPERARRDVEAFLDDLEASGLLRT